MTYISLYDLSWRTKELLLAYAAGHITYLEMKTAMKVEWAAMECEPTELGEVLGLCQD